MKKFFKKSATIVLCAALIFGAVGGGVWYWQMQGEKKAALEAAAPAAEEAVPVTTVQSETGELFVATEFIGKIQPDESVNVFSKLSGTVTAANFEIGDKVQKGDLLFEIDGQDVALSVNMARAAYNVAKVGIDRSLGSVLDNQRLQSESSLKNAQNSFSNANKTFNDYIDDFEPSLDKLDDTVSDLKTTRDELRSYSTAMEGIASQAKAAYDEAVKNATIGASDPGIASAIEKYRSNYLEARKNADLAQASYAAANSAYENAKTTYKQKQDGYDVQFDQLKTAMKGANLALQTSQDSKEIVDEKVFPEAEATADASLAQAEASLAQAERQLEFTRVYSPIDGVIEVKGVSQHGMVSQQNPAYVVSNKDIMVVRFAVPASAAIELAVGDSIDIENGSKTYNGSVVEVSGMVDAQSGLFPVKARIEEEAEGELLNGVSVKVTANTQKAQNAVLIPIDCLYHDDGASYVYIYSGSGTAKKTPVETGITDDDLIEIKSGLSAGDRVINSWSSNLRDGLLVSDETVAAVSAQVASSESADSAESAASSQAALSEPASPSSAAEPAPTATGKGE